MKKTLFFRIMLICMAVMLLLTSCGGENGETVLESESESESVVESESVTESESVSESSSETESQTELPTETESETKKETTVFYETATQIEDYKGTAATQQTNRVNIACIGDSITDNCGTYSSYRYSLYTKLYADGCSFKYTGIYSSADPRLPSGYNVHCGFSGAVIGPTAKTGSRSSYDYLSQYIGSGSNKADIVLLMLGHNNYFQSLASNEADMIKEYSNFIKKIYELNPDCIIYCASMVEQDNGKTPDENYASRYNGKGLNTLLPSIVKSFSDQGYEIYFVDMRNESGLSKDEGDFADGTHPGDRGQAKMAQVWYNHIAERVKQLNSENKGSGGKASVIPVSGLNVNYSKMTVVKGFGRQLVATVVPSNATHTAAIWTSSDASIATVDEWGVVTGIKAGTVTITATSVDGKHTTATEVTVVEPENAITYDEYYRERFSSGTAARWTGDTGGFGQSNSFWGNGMGIYYLRATIESKPKKDAGKCFKMSFRYVVDGSYDQNLNQAYTEMTYAGFELKIVDAGRKVQLKYGSTTLGTYQTERYMVYGHDYALYLDNGNVMVVRDGQILIEATIDMSGYESSSKIGFKFRETSRSLYVSDLLLAKGVK